MRQTVRIRLFHEIKKIYKFQLKIEKKKKFFFSNFIAVIYDNDITDYFVKTIERILDANDLNKTKDKELYIALEKRYVFTMADLDTMAPCYEYFLHCIMEMRKTTNWKLEFVSTDFPQYFDYERSKELILMKLHL